jgi:hypothetical protein
LLRRSTLPVWGAVTWSLLFGLLSLWWAAGGMLAVSTLARSIRDAARAGDDAMLRMALVTGLLKLAGGALALLSLRPPGNRRVRMVMLSLLWGAGVLLTLYGVLGMVEKVLWVTGATDVPASFGEDAVVWYLVLWEPVWIVGGALFLLTAWRAGRVWPNT